jgi:hypothetical protein
VKVARSVLKSSGGGDTFTDFNYLIFKEFPELLFQLIGNPPQNAAEYRFNSVAVKEPTFTIDGVFEPPVLNGTGTM